MANEEFKKGIHFKNNKLYVFGKRSAIVLASWPRMLAWRKAFKKSWKNIRVNINLNYIFIPQNIHFPKSEKFPIPARIYAKPDFNAELKEIKKAAFADLPEGEEKDRKIAWFEKKYLAVITWLNSIPAEIFELARQYATRHWHILSMLARCPRSFELVRSNPALAFCLASNWVFHKPAVKKPFRAIRSLLKKKQRDILGWLGFPGTEAMVNIFRKIKPYLMSPKLFLLLRNALKDTENIKLLCHIKDINQYLIYMLADPIRRAMFSNKALIEISGMSDDDFNTGHMGMFKDIRMMMKMLQENEQYKIYFNSLKKIREFHDELVQKVCNMAFLPERYRAELRLKTGKDFPTPPLEGTKSIIPISDIKTLHDEGVVQRNCVFSYYKQIYNNECYIYRVLEPERATLSIVKYDDEWEIDQINGYSNAPVRQETIDSVLEWLDMRNHNDNRLAALRHPDQLCFEFIKAA